MTDYQNTPGKTTVAIDVLETIARLTVLSVPGVSRLCRFPSSRFKGLFRRNRSSEGVLLEVADDTVYADLYVIVHSDVNLRDVCLTLQTEVARAIAEMIGMQVGRVNVHVEDLEYPNGA